MIITECAKLELWDVLQNIFLRNNRLYDVNEPDDDGNTLVHILSVKKREALLADVIEMGGVVNVQNKKSVSPLHMAVRMGHMAIVQLLIVNQADPNMVDSIGESPVFGAARKNLVHMVKYLVHHKAKVDMLNKLGSGLLHVSAECNSVQVAKYLIQELNVDIHRKNRSAETCLDVAVKKNQLEVAEYFISILETIDKSSPLLHIATQNRNTVLAEIIIKAGNDPNVQDSSKTTPLHLAVELQHLDLVVLLLDHMADTNHNDIDNYTPLHVAARIGNKTILKYLIHKGADIDLTTSGGDKPLHLAAMAGHVACVKVLLKYGQSVVQTGWSNSVGQSPLHLAASNGHTEVVQLLLRKQFDPLLVDRTGSTPVFVAKIREQDETYQVLRDSLTTIVVPCDRNVKDVELISTRLRRVEQLSRLPNSVIQQLALCAFYEDLEKGVTLFRQGDTGKCWYAVMTGTLDVRVLPSDSDIKMPVTLCTLGVGATFGESCLHDLPRDTTVVTQTTCELLRVEQQDFKLIWEKNKDFMNDLVSCKLKNGFGTGGIITKPTTSAMQHHPSTTPTSPPIVSPDQPSPAEAIMESPSPAIGRIGWALRTLLLSQNTCLKDRKVSGRLVRRCAPGTELVDWLIGLNSVQGVHTRVMAAGMWQALLEEGVIAHVAKEQPFKDKCFLYRFWQDDDSVTNASPATGATLPNLEDITAAEDQLQESLGVLISRAPDAVLRMILRKPSHERTADDLELIYDELMHIRALAHLTISIKRELASVVIFEARHRAGAVLFHQGDEGRSWYIILRGSVDVVIHGKGTVTTLQEGDDFGKLALINDAPRAATIVLRESNCHFLRVDKDNFNRILRDVEANTVRLKEHGKDVLVLEKIQQKQAFSNYKYTVMAGTPSKMLEHLLETRLDGRNSLGGGENFFATAAHDPFLEDFLLTHIVFMPTHQLVDDLDRYYRANASIHDSDFVVACKRRVVQFIYYWVLAIRHPIFEDESAVEFFEELALEIESDCEQYRELEEEATLMHRVMIQLRRYQDDRKEHENQKWKLPPQGQPISLFSTGNDVNSRAIIMSQDDIIFRVYCADHTYCTLRLPMDSSAESIKLIAADKLKLRTMDDLLLAEVKSSGERVIIKDNDISVPTSLTLNGRIFVTPKDHLDALTPISEQEEATQGIVADIELFSTKEIAYYMTLFDWDLFLNVHEYELIYHTFGRHHFAQITANLDVFVRRFNEIQYWIVTEICMSVSLSKRVAILRKFIKLAAYCREYQNLNAFCAIVMGLSNMAVSRLSQTWDKLPGKFRKLFTEFESVIDPSRNHRSYRACVGRLQPPVVPFMPLLLKDMTFTHEGNKTCLDGLVNFEKMHMLAQTMRTLRFCRSRQIVTVLDPPSPKTEGEVKSYISCLRAIDNQRILTNMSQKLEPRRS